MGIDLGTANTLIYVKGRGIVVQEPSVVAMEQHTRKVLAVGEEAKRMVGRTPSNIIAIRPLSDGVIADFDVAQAMIEQFIHKVHQRGFLMKPLVIIGIPSGVTEVEKRAVLEASKNAGAKRSFLIEEPMAAAIGAGLPITEPRGSMIVDIGGGTTEVAVISLGGICASKSVRVAGDEIDEAIVQYVRREHSLLIGERTAEEVKMRIGSAYPTEDLLEIDIRGRDLVTGLPKQVTITSDEVRSAIQEPLMTIVETVKQTLENTPPELSADIIESGIMLAGGGALLKGIEDLIASETNMPVRHADEPLYCVVEGCGRALEEIETLKEVFVGQA